MSWSLAYYVSEWVLRIVMLTIVTRKRRPVAATAWLLVIFFLPWPGVILYLFFGSNRLPRRRIEPLDQDVFVDPQRGRDGAPAAADMHDQPPPDPALLEELQRLRADPPRGNRHRQETGRDPCTCAHHACSPL